MYKVTVIVKRRSTILDPQGKAVEQGAKLLGYENISGTRIGKYIEFDVDMENETDAEEEVKQFCDKLLANPNIEDFEFTMEKV